MSDQHAAIVAFIATQAVAWDAGDVEAISEGIGLPQMLARGDGTIFIEDDRELVQWIEERLAAWDALGVDKVSATVLTIEDLPDDAARVTIDWVLADEDGAAVLGFAATDTLAADEGEWYYVVTDLAGEDAAGATGRA